MRWVGVNVAALAHRILKNLNETNGFENTLSGKILAEFFRGQELHRFGGLPSPRREIPLWLGKKGGKKLRIMNNKKGEEENGVPSHLPSGPANTPAAGLLHLLQPWVSSGGENKTSPRHRDDRKAQPSLFSYP